MNLTTTPHKILIPILIAATLWFYMFSPWTSGHTNFWLTMSFAAVTLTVTAILFSKGHSSFPHADSSIPNIIFQVVSGIAIAFVLWGIFWLGDKVSQQMFHFARPQVNAVYDMRTGLSDHSIALLLLFIIGPAEEFFWRGYIQREMTKLFASHKKSSTARNMAFATTCITYALIHIWSFNFMLVMAALVAGTVWGLLYRWRPTLLPALIISHAVWDALIFIILPI